MQSFFSQVLQISPAGSTANVQLA